MSPVGHGVSQPVPPDFGPARFTPDEQTSKPNEPMTRVVKDVLRLGKWKVGFDSTGQAVFWNVTPAVLAALVNTTAARMKSGDAVNLGKSHGDENLLIPVDELIAPIDGIQESGGVLWVTSYVTPEQARYLSNPAIKVSVGVLTDYIAGDGARYEIALAHVAATDRPVVTGQGRFLALTNSQFSGVKKLDFPSLVEAINTLLDAVEVARLPDSVDESTLVATLNGVAMAMGGSKPDPSKPKEGEEGGETKLPELPGGQAGMSNKRAGFTQAQLIKTINDVFVPMMGRLERLEKEKGDTAEADYTAYESVLGENGVPSVTLTNRRPIAAKIGWDKTILDGLHPTITMSNFAKANASGKPPSVGSTAMTDDEVATRLKAKGIDPKYMPKSD